MGDDDRDDDPDVAHEAQESQSGANVGFAAKMFYVQDREGPIRDRYRKLLTLLSKERISPSDFGIVVNDRLPSRSSESSNVAMVGPQSVEHGEGGVFSAQANVSEPHLQSSDVQQQQRQPEVPTSIAIQPTRDNITIAGVTVSEQSTIAVLRAACSHLQVSQSGSKAKLWQRILSTIDKQQILGETQIAALARADRSANPVHTAERPSDDQVKLHMLTHLPYADWCSSCVAAKGRPPRHERLPTRLQERETPVLSFDFCYTGKTCETAAHDDASKLVALVAHDSHSGSITCIPMRSKDDAKHAVRELVKYLQYLGHGNVCLMTDQEPAAIAIQNLLQRTWQHLGFRAVIENAKLLDHGGNAWAEKSIDLIRSQAKVLLRQLSENIGHEIPAKHPLFSWAFCHAAWLLDRFNFRANTTAYQLIRGHSYRGNVCQWGEPVMCFVGDSTKRKGDAKWKPGVMLTKSVTNDMFVVHCEGNVKLTRSVKSIFTDWSEHIAIYRSLVTQPRQIEGVLGNKVDAAKVSDIPEVVVGIDDEAADDPEAESLTIQDSTVLAEPIPVQMPSVENKRPPPATAVVASRVEPSERVAKRPPLMAQRGSWEMRGTQQAGQVDTRMEDVSESFSVPVPGPPTLPSSTTPIAAATDIDDEFIEPSSKRQKLSVMKIGEETYFHMDIDPAEHFRELDPEGYPSGSVTCEFGEEMQEWNDGESMDIEQTEVSIWRPFSEQPEVPNEELMQIDVIADRIELKRLTEMGVITQAYAGELDAPLSAKMVRTWRKKTRQETDSSGKSQTVPAWMRRSRLVGRGFNFLEHREDVYSPASSSAIVKLLPALALSGGFKPNSVLATLDVGDAFLQVPQPIPRKVVLDGVEYVILKCLPGQRDASRLWYSYFLQRLRAHLATTVCPEQPCVLRCENHAVMILHVDDVLILGDEDWIQNVLLEKLQREFRLTYTLVKRREGGELEEFLKRLHIIEPNYESITVCPEPKHSNSLIERFSQLDGKLPKICHTPSTGALPLDSEPLDCDMASEYRSLVGMAMYLSQERYDLQYATKTLASSLKTPTKAAWLGLKHLVGYLRFSEGFSLKMRKTQKGDSFMEHLMNVHSDKLRNCVEVFSDSDWSGNFDMKSTSSAINTLNGIVIHSTSRTQKAISLSSTEAEWYAASSSVCDCMFLQHIVEFLTDDDCEIFTLHTDNSAVRMLALKFGVGRLKHIRGRMLWAQQKVSLRELQIRQVKTMFNIADLNTKPLSKDRFMSLLYMLGFVSDKSAVGENEFSRMQAKEVVRSQVKTITQVLHGHIDDEDSSMRVSSSNLSKQSKRVLRVLSLCSFFTLTESMSPPEALGHGYDGKNSDISVISWYVLYAMWFVLPCEKMCKTTCSSSARSSRRPYTK